MDADPCKSDCHHTDQTTLGRIQMLKRICFVWIVVGIVLAGCGQPVRTVKRVDDYKAEARADVVFMDVQEALTFAGSDSVLFLDIREGEELVKDGKIPGALHIPRGMLEFMIDPTSSMHNDALRPERMIIVYCETGGRSLLATKMAMDMGLNEARLLDGGFRAWEAIEAPIERMGQP